MGFYVFFTYLRSSLVWTLTGRPENFKDFFQEIAEIFGYEDRLSAINDNGKPIKVPWSKDFFKTGELPS